MSGKGKRTDLREQLCKWLVVASLALAAMILALWLRSYTTADHFGQRRIRVEAYGLTTYHCKGIFPADGRICWVSVTELNTVTEHPIREARTISLGPLFQQQPLILDR